MKLTSILSAALLAATLGLSMGVQAASDTDKASEASTGKKVKPHSHVEEKTGIPQKTASSGEVKADKAKSDKPRIDKDKSKHFHPRDGK